MRYSSAVIFAFFEKYFNISQCFLRCFLPTFSCFLLLIKDRWANYFQLKFSIRQKSTQSKSRTGIGDPVGLMNSKKKQLLRLFKDDNLKSISRLIFKNFAQSIKTIANSVISVRLIQRSINISHNFAVLKKIVQNEHQFAAFDVFFYKFNHSITLQVSMSIIRTTVAFPGYIYGC